MMHLAFGVSNAGEYGPSMRGRNRRAQFGKGFPKAPVLEQLPSQHERHHGILGVDVSKLLQLVNSIVVHIQ